MKLLAIAFVCSITTFAALPPAYAAKGHDSAAESGQSKITESAARKIASDRYPNSAFESAELEQENNRLIWSIDLRPNGSNDVQEVNIDAMTGEIIAIQYETPQMQRDEAAQDKRDEAAKDKRKH